MPAVLNDDRKRRLALPAVHELAERKSKTSGRGIMKRVGFAVAAFCCAGLATAALAHGGVQQTAGNVTVTLFQEPLSPFVGEPVTLTFILTNAHTGARLARTNAMLTVTETTRGDASKDHEIASGSNMTDANGTFQYAYTFPRDGYFDIDIHTADPVSHADEETGFLVQARAHTSGMTSARERIGEDVIAFALGFGAMFLVLRRRLS